MIVAIAIALQLSAADEASLRGPGNEFHFQMCTLLKTTEYVGREEPAETVVAAAMGGCATEYGKVRPISSLRTNMTSNAFASNSTAWTKRPSA